MIVDCAAYHDGCRVADLRIDDLQDWAARPGHFVWIGLYEPTDEELQGVQRALALHDLAVEDALRAHQRPKLEEYGDSLFAVLRTVLWDEVARELKKGETHLFVGRSYVVSVRHGESPSYSPVRARCQSTPHLLKMGSGFVLYAVMDYVVDQYFPVLEAFEDEVEVLEEKVFDAQMSRDTTERIYDLKRNLIQLKRAVSPLIEVCNRLVRYDVGIVPEEARPYFRDVYDHVIRINDHLDGLRELLSSALEANLSLISIRQNDIMKQLAGWAAILAIPTMLAGIWGMNFEHMPELATRFGYPIALGLMLVVVGILYYRFRRAGWI